ncbi:molecular chaperone HtpG [Pilimelia terevasa]|uniref:Molecular chaperone HtpG n=1 Tax=Pilimelia terevasa TaxID=53372 RepID=A0A8J3BTD9_9ACTN|nr:HSP90 family protein [Pilimelia terevasa]GGK40422.1 molecular chaperone HtpG [Pilimelia terevasa]
MNSFQVDLRGVVDLLSHHLYGSPRVYLRELLQNAVDAITARRADDPGAPAVVWLEPADAGPDGVLRVHDTGVGLTEDEVHRFLATIGRSAKRDELGFARHDFLGQFGIGLLSCFMVADEVRVDTRAGDGRTVRWVGRADGRYTVGPAPAGRAERGTTVTLVPRRDAAHWLDTATVTALARTYGSMLPYQVRVGDAVTTVGALPWAPGPDRRARLHAYGRTLLGAPPFDVVPVHVPAAGLTGAAFILPAPANPVARAGHRVYLKRMLLSEGAEGLLPDWAFFARLAVDATELRPTASREALYDDGVLEEVRTALGGQIRDWLLRLSTRDPARLAAFLEIHHLGVKALALHDDDLLRMVARWWPMTTNTGPLTLTEFARRHGVLRYVATVDEFRQVAAVAAAQQLAVVNAGYTYDAALIGRLAAVDPAVRTVRLEPGDVATAFDGLDPAVELGLQGFLAAAQDALGAVDCEVVLRAYDPVSLPALYLAGRDAQFRRELAATRPQVGDDWAGVLDAIADTAPASRPQLVLNHRNPLVRRIAGLPDRDLAGAAVQGLYGQALLRGHHPVRPAEAALMNTSFHALIDRAVADQDGAM